MIRLNIYIIWTTGRTFSFRHGQNQNQDGFCSVCIILVRNFAQIREHTPRTPRCCCVHSWRWGCSLLCYSTGFVLLQHQIDKAHIPTRNRRWMFQMYLWCGYWWDTVEGQNLKLVIFAQYVQVHTTTDCCRGGWGDDRFCGAIHSTTSEEQKLQTNPKLRNLLPLLSTLLQLEWVGRLSGWSWYVPIFTICE